MREQWRPGETAWFEYHCWESSESNDAQVWYHSHQQVIVLQEYECDGQREYLPTYHERAAEGMPITYEVRFADGLTWTVFEDELLEDPAQFERPDPPKESERSRNHGHRDNVAGRR